MDFYRSESSVWITYGRIDGSLKFEMRETIRWKSWKAITGRYYSITYNDIPQEIEEKATSLYRSNIESRESFLRLWAITHKARTLNEAKSGSGEWDVMIVDEHGMAQYISVGNETSF